MESQIDKELDEFEKRRQKFLRGEGGEAKPPTNGEERNTIPLKSQLNGENSKPLAEESSDLNISSDTEKAKTQKTEPNGSGQFLAESETVLPEIENQAQDDEHAKDVDDHHGELVVEADEDTVIY